MGAFVLSLGIFSAGMRYIPGWTDTLYTEMGKVDRIGRINRTAWMFHCCCPISVLCVTCDVCAISKRGVSLEAGPTAEASWASCRNVFALDAGFDRTFVQTELARGAYQIPRVGFNISL